MNAQIPLRDVIVHPLKGAPTLEGEGDTVLGESYQERIEMKVLQHDECLAILLVWRWEERESREVFVDLNHFFSRHLLDDVEFPITLLNHRGSGATSELGQVAWRRFHANVTCCNVQEGICFCRCKTG